MLTSGSSNVSKECQGAVFPIGQTGQMSRGPSEMGAQADGPEQFCFSYGPQLTTKKEGKI